MHFCTVCQNMYYIKLSGENDDKLIYYCRKCGHTDDTITTNSANICVSRTDIKSSTSSFEHIINKYTKLDPTLPRIHNIKCPNIHCRSNRSDSPSGATKEGGEHKGKVNGNPEIIYLRYDDANMKFVYICSQCDTVWKSATTK